MKSPRCVLGLASIWIMLSVMQPSRACMKLREGYPMEWETFLLKEFYATDGPCICCGECHSHPGCVSFAFRRLDNYCWLYKEVAGPETFWKDEDYEYFVMPGKSGSGQLCRHDWDCTESGEACQSGVCKQPQETTSLASSGK